VHAAKLYKWVDEAGNTHYSQTPDSDRDSQQASPATEAQAEPVEHAPLEIPPPTDLAASQQLADKCQGLYRDLELYKDHSQITDTEGKVMVISPEMREAKIAEIKSELDKSCR